MSSPIRQTTNGQSSYKNRTQTSKEQNNELALRRQLKVEEEMLMFKG